MDGIQVLLCGSAYQPHPLLSAAVSTHKIALHMAATVLNYPVFVLFLLVFPIFFFSNMISFTRDELLLLDFDYSDVLLNVVVGGAVALIKLFRTYRRGKQAGALVKLRQRGFRMDSLASIWRISALYPTIQTNFFCSPGQTRIFQTLLLCASRKSG